MGGCEERRGGIRLLFRAPSSTEGGFQAGEAERGDATYWPKEESSLIPPYLTPPLAASQPIAKNLHGATALHPTRLVMAALTPLPAVHPIHHQPRLCQSNNPALNVALRRANQTFD